MSRRCPCQLFRALFATHEEEPALRAKLKYRDGMRDYICRCCRYRTRWRSWKQHRKHQYKT